MGAATDNAFGGRGTFHSSWAKEELDTEPPLGDHFDSLGLAVCEQEIKNFLLQTWFIFLLCSVNPKLMRRILLMKTVT